jgi:hypothetical protein
MLSSATLIAEIDKCDLVCANCHAIRTQKSKAVRKKAVEALRASLAKQK